MSNSFEKSDAIIAISASGVMGLSAGGIAFALTERYRRIKDAFEVGQVLKPDDMAYLKKYEEFLGLKPAPNESQQDFSKRKYDFFQKNYQFFLEYESFAKQLNFSLFEYISMNVDATLHRPSWVQSAKKLNRNNGGILSDETIELLSKRIFSYSPSVDGNRGVNFTTQELLHEFVRHANTPPDGQYFACMLEDFVNSPKFDPVIFVPDNGWLKAHNAGGVFKPDVKVIQILNNNIGKHYSVIMHEIYHAVNQSDVIKIRKKGHYGLGQFFDEALSVSVNWLTDPRRGNAVAKDIRTYYENEAKKLYPYDLKKQTRYAYTKARGRYITIMLAGGAKNIEKAINDFYTSTGAKKTATLNDIEAVIARVNRWYLYYQNHYRYTTPQAGDATRGLVNAYLKEHFGADVQMGEDFIYELDNANRLLIQKNLRKQSDGSYKITYSTKKEGIRIWAELKNYGIKPQLQGAQASGEIIILPEYADAVAKLQMEHKRIHSNMIFCFEKKKVNGQVVYEVPKVLSNYAGHFRKIQDYWAQNGVEIEYNAETKCFQMKPESVPKYEAYISRTFSNLMFEKLKMGHDGLLYLDCQNMDQNAVSKIFRQYRNMGFDIAWSKEGKILFKGEDCFAQLHYIVGDDVCDRFPNLRPQNQGYDFVGPTKQRRALTPNLDMPSEASVIPDISQGSVPSVELKLVRQTQKGARYGYTYMFNAQGMSLEEQTLILEWFKSQGLEFKLQGNVFLMTDSGLETLNKQRKVKPLSKNPTSANGAGPRTPAVNPHNSNAGAEDKTSPDARVKISSNGDRVRLNFSTQALKALKSTGGGLVFSSMDSDLVRDVTSGDVYNTADGVISLPWVLVSAFENTDKLPEVASEIWDKKWDYVNQFVVQSWFQSGEAIGVGINNLFGHSSVDIEQSLPSYQEFSTSYKAQVSSGKLLGATKQRYKWAFTPLKKEVTNPDTNELELQEDTSSGVLRIYSPVFAKSALTNATSSENQEESAYKLEAKYYVRDGRVVSRAVTLPDGTVEMHYYDQDKDQSSVFLRASEGSEMFDQVQMVDNELEALWGPVNSEVLDNIRIGNRTHIVRETPALLGNIQIQETTNEAYLFNQTATSQVEVEYFSQENKTQTSYEKKEVTRTHSIRISKEELDKYLASKNMTLQQFISQVEKEGKWPSELENKVKIQTSESEKLATTGSRTYRSIYADSHEMAGEELTGAAKAVIINPYLRREYATCKTSDVNYSDGVNGSRTVFVSSQQGDQVQRTDYYTIQGGENQAPISYGACDEYVYVSGTEEGLIDNPDEAEKPKKLGCVLNYNADNELVGMQDAQGNSYGFEDLVFEGKRMVLYVPTEDENEPLLRVDLTDYISPMYQDKNGNYQSIENDEFIKVESDLSKKYMIDEGGVPFIQSDEKLSFQVNGEVYYFDFDENNQLIGFKDASNKTYGLDALKVQNGRMVFCSPEGKKCDVTKYLDPSVYDPQTKTYKKVSKPQRGDSKICFCRSEAYTTYRYQIPETDIFIQVDKNGKVISALKEGVACSILSDNGKIYVVNPEKEGERLDVSAYLNEKNGQPFVMDRKTKQRIGRIDKFCRKKRDNEKGYLMQRSQLPFLPGQKIKGLNLDRINPSHKALRMIKQEKQSNSQADVYQLYWSDGSVMGVVVEDKATGALGIYRPNGDLALVDSPLDFNEQGTDWHTNPKSKRFERVTHFVCLEQYQSLKENNPQIFSLTMAKWMLLTDEQIAKSDNPELLGLIRDIFVKRYKSEYPEQAEEVLQSLTPQTEELNLDFTTDIQETVGGLAEKLKNHSNALAPNLAGGVEQNKSRR